VQWSGEKVAHSSGSATPLHLAVVRKWVVGVDADVVVSSDREGAAGTMLPPLAYVARVSSRRDVRVMVRGVGGGGGPSVAGRL
jgi:uncharacterized protein (UPF0261 family)